jgi:hypothetical protein
LAGIGRAVFGERRQADGEALVGFGVGARERCGDGRGLSLRLFDRDGGREPGHHIQKSRAPGRPLDAGRSGDDNFVIAGIERLRIDADHRVGAATERDRAAQDARVRAEAAGPERAGQDGDRIAVADLFGSRNAADYRRMAEHIEGPAEDAKRGDAFGAVAAFERDLVAVEAHHRGEGGHAAVPVGKALRVAVAGVAVVGFDERDEAIGIGQRQGPEQHLVDDAEHRRGRADADAEREHDRCGQAGPAGEAARGDAKVAGEAVEPGEGVGVADFFGDAGSAAEAAIGLGASLGGVDALGDQFVGGGVDVELQLIGDVAVDGAAVEDRVAKPVEPRHVRPTPARQRRRRSAVASFLLQRRVASCLRGSASRSGRGDWSR